MPFVYAFFKQMPHPHHTLPYWALPVSIVKAQIQVTLYTLCKSYLLVEILMVIKKSMLMISFS